MNYLLGFADVRFGSFASIWRCADHFRSATINGHSQGASACLKGAISGLMHCGILAVDEYARTSCNDTPFVIDDLYSREC
jgi:hypothetical protein